MALTNIPELYHWVFGLVSLYVCEVKLTQSIYNGREILDDEKIKIP